MADPPPPTERQPDPPSLGRTLTLVVLALVALGSIGVFVWRVIVPGEMTQVAQVAPPSHPPAPTAGSSAASAPSPAQTPTPAPAPAPVAPSFDIVRVDPSGSAVIAGRADPSADVSIRSDGKDLAQVTADSQGAWAFGPTEPLPPGSHALTLVERTKAGKDIPGQTSVTMVVPERNAPASTPLVVATGPSQPPTVLQGPPGTTTKPGQLGLGAVEYDNKGELRLSGTAPPNTTLRLYADNHPIGEVHSSPEGRWSLVPGTAVPEGTHNLRLDELAPNGKVAARREMPFQRESIESAALAEGKVVVQPGNSLWRIASRVYGKGIRYTIIYRANQAQIRNPDLIYPGQVFALPPEGAPKPASSSTSK